MNDLPEARANELDRCISAYQPGATLPDTPPEHWSDREMAVGLLGLAESLRPDAHFVAELERRLTGSDVAANPAASGTTPPPAAQGINGRARHHRRRWATWTGIAATLLISLVLFAPPVRAGVEALWRIGVVRISRGAPTPAIAGPTATPLSSLLDLAGQTTLSNARHEAGFAIRLPTYPASLGPPDLVFLQNENGPMVVLVWLVPGHPNQVRMSLHELSSNLYVEKFAPPVIETTTVHGQPAVWTDGPYLVVVRDGSLELRRLVTGHVLIWTEGGITYRLETSVSLSEAVRIAESLR